MVPFRPKDSISDSIDACRDTKKWVPDPFQVSVNADALYGHTLEFEGHTHSKTHIICVQYFRNISFSFTLWDITIIENSEKLTRKEEKKKAEFFILSVIYRNMVSPKA